MGSNPSKHTKPKRSRSDPQLSIRANGHIPVRRATTGINTTGLEPNDSSFTTIISEESPNTEFPEDVYQGGKLGLTVSIL